MPQKIRQILILTLLGLIFFFGATEIALADSVFSQIPINEDNNGPVLNSPYPVMFGCTAGLNCGVSGQTIHNVGIWIKKVGNPSDVRLQVVDTWQSPTTSESNFSTSIPANTISDTAYTLKWFYFPTGVVIGNQYDFNQFFQFQFTQGNNTYDPINHYQVLYNPSSDYSAPQQWCRIYLGCWSSTFFWIMDDEPADLSLQSSTDRATLVIEDIGNDVRVYGAGIMCLWDYWAVSHIGLNPKGAKNTTTFGFNYADVTTLYQGAPLVPGFYTVRLFPILTYTGCQFDNWTSVVKFYWDGSGISYPISITSPANTTTLEDFSLWQLDIYTVASTTEPRFVDVKYGTASTTFLYSDTNVISSNLIGTSTINITKSLSLASTTPLRWYAQAYLREGLTTIATSPLTYFDIQPASTTCTVNCYSNILFLPGHQASRLYQSSVLFEDRLWEPNITNISDFSALALSPTTGESINDDIYTKDIIDESYTELQGFNIYKKFIEFMDAKEGEGLFEEWKVIPYDWRLDFDQLLSNGKVIGGTEENPLISYTQATSSPYIFQELERLVDSSRNGKVTLITHSNGGLLAKYLLGEISNPLHPYHHLYTQIDKVIMVAAPQVGTPKAIEGLLHGNSTQLGVVEWGIIIDEAQSREFAENMQSAYNLLPSDKYFDVVQSPVIEFDPDVSNIYDFPSLYGTKITTPEMFNRFLLGDNGLRIEPDLNDEEAPNVLKSLFLDKAQAVHNTLDSWIPPPHIEVIQIAGWGIKTIKGLRYDDCDIVFCPDTLSNLDRKILKTQQGDGTVVLPSAIVMAGQPNVEMYYVNIRDHNKRGVLNSTRNRDHANILEIESLQEFIKNIVLNTRTFTEDVYVIEPTPKPGDTLIDFSLHSPVALHLYDSSGKHTGIISNSPASTRIYEATIPNSYYEEHGEIKYAGVSGATTTTIVLRGEDLGTFTLNIEESFGDEIIAQASFTDIPVTASTSATLSLGSIDTMTALAVDVDGNGSVDATLTGNDEDATNASFDILVTILNSLDIHKGLKKDLIEKIQKAQIELEKGATQKVLKELDKVVKVLEHEIEKNLKKSYNAEEKDIEKQKISNEDAGKLIRIIETLRGEVV